MNRRGFLQSILIAASAPAIIKANVLMGLPRRPSLFMLDAPPWALQHAIRSGLISSEMGALLWPGVKEWWGEAYSKGGIWLPTGDTWIKDADLYQRRQ